MIRRRALLIGIAASAVLPAVAAAPAAALPAPPLPPTPAAVRATLVGVL